MSSSFFTGVIPEQRLFAAQMIAVCLQTLDLGSYYSQLPAAVGSVSVIRDIAVFDSPKPPFINFPSHFKL